MAKFNIGDHITPDNVLKGVNVYEITEVWGRVRVIEFGQGCNRHVNFVGALVSRDIDDLYILHKEANPNLITVSSLDYNDSTTLSQEDKEIIKEYLYENS